MVDTTDNRGPNMKHIMNTLCNDMMSWDELEDRVLELEDKLSETQAMLATSDKGLLKASDPKSGWQGINLECKLWQEKYEAAAERERVLEEAAQEAFSKWNSGTHEQESAGMIRLKDALAQVKEGK